MRKAKFEPKLFWWEPNFFVGFTDNEYDWNITYYFEDGLILYEAKRLIDLKVITWCTDWDNRLVGIPELED